MTSVVPFPKQNQNAKPVTPKDIEMAELKLSKAKTHLLLNGSPDAAFWACLGMNTPYTWDQTVGTAAMGIRQMWFNPHFVNSLTVMQVVFLLAHELGHKMYMHMARRGERDRRAWNIAGDKSINDMLVAGNIGEAIEGGVFQSDARLKTTEELYEEPEEDGPGGGQGYGNGDGGYGIGDDLVEEQMSQAEQIAAEQEIQVEVSQAGRAAKMKGNLSAGLQRVIDEITISKTPWFEKLRHLMQFFVKSDYSWRRPNRRFASQGVYLPSSNKIPKMGAAVIFIDTSGSIGGPELAVFFGELNKIVEDLLPEMVYLIYCDHAAYYGTEFTPEDLPILPSQQKVQGGGGTSFKPAFQMVDDMGLEVEVGIYLTDGYGDWETCTDPGYPVIWVSTAATEGAAFGEVIKIEG